MRRLVVLAVLSALGILLLVPAGSRAVPAGQTETTFTITTNAAAAPVIVQITAWVENTNALRTADLSVNPAPPAGPTLSSASVDPASTTGGSGVTGTVTFTAPMNDGANVQMSSSNPAVASVPAEVVVGAGASKYSGSKGFITRPNRIEVRSNFGGSAFATVTT